jgi:hypothetical protein
MSTEPEQVPAGQEEIEPGPERDYLYQGRAWGVEIWCDPVSGLLFASRGGYMRRLKD